MHFSWFWNANFVRGMIFQAILLTLLQVFLVITFALLIIIRYIKFYLIPDSFIPTWKYTRIRVCIRLAYSKYIRVLAANIRKGRALQLPESKTKNRTLCFWFYYIKQHYKYHNNSITSQNITISCIALNLVNCNNEIVLIIKHFNDFDLVLINMFYKICISS